MPPEPASPAARPERELVDAARAGDAAAFRMLVETHGARVHGIARRMLRSPEEAEEAAQDAFVRAWRALPYFRGEAAVSTWLHRIVVRVAYDRLRARASRRTHEIPWSDGVEARAEAPATTPGGAGDVRWDALLETLPDVPRAALVLYYWEDRSVRDVADILELPEGTVKSHLARARASLRAAYLRARAREANDDRA